MRLSHRIVTIDALGGGSADVPDIVQTAVGAVGSGIRHTADDAGEKAAELQRNPRLSQEGREGKIKDLRTGLGPALAAIREIEPVRALEREGRRLEREIAQAMALPRDTTEATLREVREVVRALPETERLDRLREWALEGDTAALAALAGAPPSLRLVPDAALDEARAIAARARAPDLVHRLEMVRAGLELVEGNLQLAREQLARQLGGPIGDPPEPRELARGEAA